MPDRPDRTALPGEPSCDAARLPRVTLVVAMRNKTAHIECRLPSVRRPFTYTEPPGKRRAPQQASQVEVIGMPTPKVTLIVPMRNEARFIEACLRSILDQRYPPAALEILVYDGGSTDDSRAIVERLAAAHPGIVLLENPSRTQAAAWNLGIDRAMGDVIGILGAHSEYAADYVTTAVETLERTGADMVGGPMRAHGEGTVGRAVAVATSTPFGVGGARFHYAQVEADVDTVYLGLCRSEVYRSLRFDEEMVRDQDDELSYRLLDRGGRIVCNPAIRSRYHNRSTLAGLARQYFEYGYWKVRVMQKHPRQIRLRHLVPPTFVLALAVTSLLTAVTPVGVPALGLVAGTYGAANVAASIVASYRELALAPVVFAVFAILHVSYGAGFLVGLLRFGLGRRRAAAGRAA